MAELTVYDALTCKKDACHEEVCKLNKTWNNSTTKYRVRPKTIKFPVFIFNSLHS